MHESNHKKLEHMTPNLPHPYLGALQWHLDVGADEAIADHPVNRTQTILPASEPENASLSPRSSKSVQVVMSSSALGTAAARDEATRLAKSCQSLDELRAAIAGFGGLAIRETATNMVFADGNPNAPVMLVGEAPGADEDKQGKPFVGQSGQLLDRILKSIGLARGEEDPSKAIYISNILNWRPPGNRTPTDGEVQISLPFIERHIELIHPKVLILCGGVSAKGLLQSGESISKLRGRFHEYQPSVLKKDTHIKTIPAIATYHPAYLLRTPSQKKAVWMDMLLLQDHLNRRL
jgi:uracil-DNA glycosylase